MDRTRAPLIVGLLGALAALTLLCTWAGRNSLRGTDTSAGLIASPRAPGLQVREGTRQSRPARQAVEPIALLSTSPGELGSCAPETICGVVLTRDGQPCIGAVCSLLPGEAPQGMRFARGRTGTVVPVASCGSDVNGDFVLPAAEGYWTLKVEHPAFRHWQADFVRSGSYWRVIMERPRLLVVQVENEKHEPVPTAQVLLLDDPYSNPVSARVCASSDTTGQAVIELPEGESWFIQVSHPSYQVVVFAAPVTDAARSHQTVTLLTGIRIFGTVITASTGKQARPEVLIDEWAPGPSRALECDAQGRFDSGPVFAKGTEVELTARAEGLAEVRKVVHLEKEALNNGGYEVNFALQSAGVRVFGQVVAPGARLAGPADVFLQPLDAGPFLDVRKLTSPAVRWRPLATTDEAGRFEIDQLMVHQGYQLLVVPREGFSNALVRIPPLAAGASHDVGVIEVEPAGRLFGFARYADGAPAPHLHITGIATIPMTWDQMKDPEYFPSQHAGRQDTYTSPDGRFEFALLPGETTYTLYWGDGSMDKDRLAGELKTRSGQEVGPVIITIPSEGMDLATLSGIVVDGLGTPLESVLVEAWNGPATDVVGEGFRSGNLTDAFGAFALERLVSGKSYRVTATDLRGRFTTGEWSVGPTSGKAPLVLTLVENPRQPGLLEGVVTNKEGIPLPGLEVTLHLSPLLVRCDCLSWGEKTDEQGAFSFGLVTEGFHQVAIMDPEGRHRPAIAAVSPGAFKTIVIE